MYASKPPAAEAGDGISIEGTRRDDYIATIGFGGPSTVVGTIGCNPAALSSALILFRYRSTDFLYRPSCVSSFGDTVSNTWYACGGGRRSPLCTNPMSAAIWLFRRTGKLSGSSPLLF